MINILAWIERHNALLLWMAGLSAVMFVASVVAVPWMLVRIPPRYFMTRRHAHPWRDRHPLVRAALFAAKNTLGATLVAVGILLLVLPGQGILTILAGLVLLDLPGKHRVLLWTISRPAVLNSINWIREKAGRESLMVPGLDGDPGEHT